MDRTCSSNKTNRTDRVGTIRARPTTMGRSITTVESTDNGIILAVPDINTTHTHDNSNSGKQAEMKTRNITDYVWQKASSIYKTKKVQRGNEAYIQRTPTAEGAQRGGAAARGKKKEASSSNEKALSIIKYFTASPSVVVEMIPLTTSQTTQP